MTKTTKCGYIKYSDEFKRQVLCDFHQSGLSYKAIKDKYNIGCVSTVKSWVANSKSGKIGKETNPTTPMVSKAEYKALLAENKRLKVKVAECYLLMDIDKYRQESTIELLGHKQAEAIDKLTKKKLL